MAEPVGPYTGGTPLVLASASPRRLELLERVGLSPDVDPARVDEAHRPGESAERYVARVSGAKATTVAARHRGAVVLAADTAVVLDGLPLGKPADARDPAAAALEMLGRLSGRTHRVVTAVCVVGPDGRRQGLTDTAEVTMAELDADERRRYVATGEPMDKAGAYAVQGAGAALVTRVAGDPTTVIGLPLRPTLALLASVAG